MDVVERTKTGPDGADGVVGSDVLDRYELAAALCSGMRVAEVGGGPAPDVLREQAAELRTVETDVAEFLSSDLRSRFDALVMLDAAGRPPDFERVWNEVVRQAQEGLRLVVSLPNSRAAHQDSHAGFAYEEAMELFSQFEDAVAVYQFLAEGSLLGLDPAAEVDGKVVLVDRAEAEYANHFLACVNFGGPGPVASALGARMHLRVVPVANRYLRQLEEANRELRRANVRLSRERLGTADAAAARRLHALEQRASAAEAGVRARDEKIAEQEAVMIAVWNSVSWRITRPLRAAKELLETRLRR